MKVLFGLIPHNYDAVGLVANTIDEFIVVIDGIACTDGVDYHIRFSIHQILVLCVGETIVTCIK